MTTSKSATDLLDDAKQIQTSRASEYDNGEQERSMGSVVAAFYHITGVDLTEAEGWEFMCILKQVRYFSAANAGKPHNDSLADLVSYAALLGESAWDNRPECLGIAFPLQESTPSNPMEEYLNNVQSMVDTKSAGYGYLNSLDSDKDAELIQLYVTKLKQLAGASEELESAKTDTE